MKSLFLICAWFAFSLVNVATAAHREVDINFKYEDVHDPVGFDFNDRMLANDGLAAAAGDPKEQLISMTGGSKGIEREYNSGDIAFVLEGGFDFIFPHNETDGLTFLATAYVSHCVVVILYNTDERYRFAYMTHMNARNSWADFANSFEIAKREFAEHYQVPLNEKSLGAIVLSGNPDPTSSDSKNVSNPYAELTKLGIDIEKINMDYYRNKAPFIHDVIFDTLANKFDANQYHLYFSFEKEGDFTTYYRSTDVEIPIRTMEDAISPLARRLSEYLKATKLTSEEYNARCAADPMGMIAAIKDRNFTTPLIRTTANTCNKCGKSCKVVHCKACKLLNYCGVACQRADWARHRKECAKLQRHLGSLSIDSRGILPQDFASDER